MLCSKEMYKYLLKLKFSRLLLELQGQLHHYLKPNFYPIPKHYSDFQLHTTSYILTTNFFMYPKWQLFCPNWSQRQKNFTWSNHMLIWYTSYFCHIRIKHTEFECFSQTLVVVVIFSSSWIKCVCNECVCACVHTFAASIKSSSHHLLYIGTFV